MATAFGCFAPSAAADWAQKLDPIFADALAQGEIPGASVVVIEDNRVVYTQGYGQATDAGQPFTPQTRSYLGSVSKSFVGLAIIQLVRAGEVALDADARTYLPTFTARDNAQAITVRQLLNHTSGFSQYTGNRNQTATSQALGALRDTVAELADWSLQSAPGTAFDYSNANYQVLGRIIEVVTGQPFDKAMHALVFEPLGMHNTQISHPFNRPDAAMGYRFWGTTMFEFSDPMGAALMPQGGVSTTALDMGRYLLALSGGAGDIPDVWHPDIAAPHSIAGAADNYAAGWSVKGRRLGTSISPPRTERRI